MPRLAGTARLLRLWDLLVYLDKSAYISIKQLAREFGTSVAEIRSDLELLAGIETPDNIGFYLVDLDFDALEDEGLVKLSLQAPARIPVQLANDDVIPLIAGLKAVATSDFVKDDPSRTAVVASALEKLTKISGAKAVALDIRLPVAPNSIIAKQIETAIANKQQLELEYVNSDDIVTNRIVDPALVVMQNRYAYLRAWCHEKAAERAFRIDRILRAKPIGQACAEHLALIPITADVASEAAARSNYQATLTLKPTARWLAEELTGQVEDLPSGAFRLTINVAAKSWLIRLLLGIAPDVLAIEPTALANEVAEVAEKALTNYEISDHQK